MSLRTSARRNGRSSALAAGQGTAAAALFAAALAALGGTARGQLTDTFTGGATGNWNTPGNWSLNVVPQDNGPNTYTVVIPGLSAVNFDLPSVSVSGLNLQNTSELDLIASESLTVSGPAVIGGKISANGVGSVFTALNQFNGFVPSSQLSALAGGVIKINAPTYTTNQTYGGIFIQADAANSLLDLHATTKFLDTNVGTNTAPDIVQASNGGIIDLSSCLTIQGNQGIGTLQFTIGSGSNIKLNALTQVTNPAGNDSRFGPRTLLDVGVLNYALPSLATADGLGFNIVPNGRVDVPLLTTLRDGTINMPGAFVINAPLLTDVQGSIIGVTRFSTLTTGALTNIKDTELYASNAGVLHVAATTYSNARSYGRTFMQSDGTGSLLDLHTVTQFLSLAAPQNNTVDTVAAMNGGVIDLSGTTKIQGELSVNGTLQFTVGTGSDINFNALTQITNPIASTSLTGVRTLFNVQSANYTLPQLATADSLGLQTDSFTTFNLPKLTQLRDGIINMADGSFINAPLLKDVQGSIINVDALTILNTPAFTKIDNAEFHVSDGGTLRVGASSYINNRTYSRAFMTSDGSGSLLDLSSLTSFISQTTSGNVDTVQASNAGVIDLSGTTLIQGNQSDAGGGTLRFQVQSGGLIKLGSPALTSGSISFALTDNNSTIAVAGSFNLTPRTALNMSLGSTLAIGGNFSYTVQADQGQTGTQSFDIASGHVLMNGATVQSVEVASANIGLPPQGPLNIPNFQFGQLEVGINGRGTIVKLVDNVNNGNRTAFPTEALYLQGLLNTVTNLYDDGIHIHDGGTLVLGNLPVYAVINNVWVQLNGLIPVGQNIVAYDGGYISNSASVIGGGWKNNAGGTWGVDANWWGGQPNAAGYVAYFGPGLTAPALAATLETGKTVGLISFDNPTTAFTINGSPITLSATGGAKVEVRQGSPVITAPLVFAGATTFDVQKPASTLTINQFFGSANTSLEKVDLGSLLVIGSNSYSGKVNVSGGNVTFAATQHLGVVNVAAGATVKLSPSTPAGGIVLGATALNLAGAAGAWTAQVDIGNGGMALDYPTAGPSPLATILDQIASGSAGGAWNGQGITSSRVTTSAGHSTIGYGEASTVLGISGTQTGTFMGQTVDATTVLLRYTTFGDANLDGQVNFADFVVLSNHFGTNVSGGWASGDFNGDGTVSFADFVLLSNNFGSLVPAQAPSAPPIEAAAINASAVPEPASASLLALAAAGLLARRRRQA